MRKSTMLVTALVAASALTVSWRIGDLLTPEPIDLATLGGPLPSASPEPESSAPATEDGSPAPTGSGKPSTGTNPKSNPSQKPIPAAPKTATFSSDPIDYKYGVVQVALTKVGKDITDIQMIQGDASNGRGEAYTILIDATIKTQSTNYGNVSGATFTTDAFKKAISNVLGKF